MYSSDVIRRKKQQAIYTNYQAILNTQPTCVAANCIQGGCIVRYPDYAFKQDVAGGAAACACGCSPTVVPSAVEPMFSMTMSVSEPVSFQIRTLVETDSLVVDWGDGSRSVYTTADVDLQPGFAATVTHTYAVPDDYTISVSSPTDAQIIFLEIISSSTTNKVTSIVFTPIAKLTLTEINLRDNLLSTIDVSNCPSLQELILTNNILTVNAVNTILVDLANGAYITGNAQLDGQTPEAIPTGAGAAALAILIGSGRNWTISVDPIP